MVHDFGGRKISGIKDLVAFIQRSAQGQQGETRDNWTRLFVEFFLRNASTPALDQLVGGAKISVADFLADQTFGFWGDVDVHDVFLLLFSE